MSQLSTALQLANTIRFFLFLKLYPNKTLTLSDLWDVIQSDEPEGQSVRIFNNIFHLAQWLAISVNWGRTLTISDNSHNPIYSLTDMGREYVEEEAARQGISLKEVPVIDGLSLLTLTYLAHVHAFGPIQVHPLVERLNKLSEDAVLPLTDARKTCEAIQPAINAGLITATQMNRGGSMFSITPAGLETLKRWIEICHADGFLLEVPIPA